MSHESSLHNPAFLDTHIATSDTNGNVSMTEYQNASITSRVFRLSRGRVDHSIICPISKRAFHLYLPSLIVAMLLFSLARGQEKTGGNIHGLIVGDYFYKANGDQQPYGDSLSQYSHPIPRDFQAFQIRRLHFFYDYTISESFFTRFQLEGNNKSLEPGGRLGLYVKTAYGEWRNIFRGSSLLAGLVRTPTWSSVEGIWGYRSIEKTITDARNLSSGSDLGVLLRGSVPTIVPFKYAVMIGNGSGQKPENNKYKKYYGMLSVTPFDHLSAEVYADYEPAEANQDRTTIKAFISYQEPSFMAGMEILQQTQRNQDLILGDFGVFGASLFSWYKPADHFKIFARADYYDPNRFASNEGFRELFLSFGLDYAPIKEFHFMPNLWVNTFADKSTLHLRKDADIVPRITFLYLFGTLQE
jgi:hypothetical protein